MGGSAFGPLSSEFKGFISDFEVMVFLFCLIRLRCGERFPGAVGCTLSFLGATSESASMDAWA